MPPIWGNNGTPGGFQLDAVLKSLVVPTQVEVGNWAATPAGDRQMTASKAAPQRLLGTGWIGRIVARASRLERWSPDFMPASSPASFQELGRLLITPKFMVSAWPMFSASSKTSHQVKPRNSILQHVDAARNAPHAYLNVGNPIVHDFCQTFASGYPEFFAQS